MISLEILKQLGFTEGELKVYNALVKLKKSTITKIIEESGVSSSKVYLILDKLTNKGLVNYILVNNIKEFQLADPTNILDNIKNEKERLNNIESEAQQLVSEIKKTLKQNIQETASIYKGLSGVKTAHLNLINELNKGEEYVFFSVEKNAVEKKEVQLMFKSVHMKRDERGVTARGIAQTELRSVYYKSFKINKKYNVKFHELTLNQGITIGKNRIIIETDYPDAFAVEIVSTTIANSYKEFFNKLWKTAKN